ncbi:MAG: DUF4384 domain-containing protein [Planctomycetota bacterium]
MTTTVVDRVHPRRRTAWMAASALLLGTVACETVLPFAGRLLATAVGNYDPKYGKLVEDLTAALRKQPSDGRTAAETPLKLEVALLRQEDHGDQVVPAAMANGEELHWRGNLEDSDRFKIFFRPSAACYVYVVLVDSTGFVQVLHPETGVGQSTRAGAETFLPPGPLDQAYAVDEHLGVETIYFVAARERRLDLEHALQPFIGRQRPTLSDPRHVTSLEDDFIELGVASRQAGDTAQVQVGDGRAQFDTQAFLEAAGSALVLTRWFEHR